MLEATEIEAIVSDLVFVNIYCNSNPDYDSVLKGLQALNLSYEQTMIYLIAFVKEDTNVN